MPLSSVNEAQELFSLFFAIYFSLIIDRANQNYNPYDTYNAWRGHHVALKRLITAWMVLHILPLLHFAVVFTLLGKYNISFNETPLGVANIILVGIISFFDFGYYRIFEGFLYRFPNEFYTDDEAARILTEDRHEFHPHFIPGILYVLVTMLLLFIMIYLNTMHFT